MSFVLFFYFIICLSSNTLILFSLFVYVPSGRVLNVVAIKTKNVRVSGGQTSMTCT